MSLMNTSIVWSCKYHSCLKSLEQLTLLTVETFSTAKIANHSDLTSSFRICSGTKSLVTGQLSLLRHKKTGPHCQKLPGPSSLTLAVPLVARSAGFSSPPTKWRSSAAQYFLIAVRLSRTSPTRLWKKGFNAVENILIAEIEQRESDVHYCGVQSILSLKSFYCA